MEFSYGIVDEAIITGFDFFRTGIDFLDLTFVIFDVFRLFGSRTIAVDFVLGFSSRTFQAEFVYGLIRDFTLESCLELLKGFLQGICFFGRIKDFVGGFYWNIHQGSFRFWNLFYEVSRTPCLGFLFGVRDQRLRLVEFVFRRTFCVQVSGFVFSRTSTGF